MNTWIKLLNRECSLAFQAEVPLVNRDFLPKVVGCQINNFWCENITYGVYYQNDELKTLANTIREKILKDTNFPNKNIKECYRLGNALLKNLTVNNNADLKKCSNDELLKSLNRFRNAYLNFLPYLVYPHAIERYFMEEISNALKKHLTLKNKDGEFSYIYEILTTPTIHEVEQQINILKSAHLLKTKGWSSDTRKSILKLQNKYAWQTYWSISAKPLTYKYFEDSVSALAQENKSLLDEIKLINKSQKERQKILKDCLNSIKAPKLLRAYVELLQGYMYLRTYRKNIICQAHYSHMPLLLEIGRRMDIGEDIKLVSYEEMITYLENSEKVLSSAIKERKQAWAVLAYDGKISIISGKKSVENIAKKYGIEDVKKQTSQKVVKGQPACLGKTTGKARIILNIREFHKIVKGDVLITPMTTPDFVPVLRKVSAIVTDEGGVTCHAAIVSREFNIPCIVGTGNATKIFKDGELIEVDANSGIAKIV